MTPAPTAASVIARSGDCRITHMMLMIRLLAINRMAATNRLLHRNTRKEEAISNSRRLI